MSLSTHLNVWWGHVNSAACSSKQLQLWPQVSDLSWLLNQQDLEKNFECLYWPMFRIFWTNKKLCYLPILFGASAQGGPIQRRTCWQIEICKLNILNTEYCYFNINWVKNSCIYPDLPIHIHNSMQSWSFLIL